MANAKGTIPAINAFVFPDSLKIFSERYERCRECMPLLLNRAIRMADKRIIR